LFGSHSLLILHVYAEAQAHNCFFFFLLLSTDCLIDCLKRCLEGKEQEKK
jgi:hypothetical protein